MKYLLSPLPEQVVDPISWSQGLLAAVRLCLYKGCRAGLTWRRDDQFAWPCTKHPARHHSWRGSRPDSRFVVGENPSRATAVVLYHVFSKCYSRIRTTYSRKPPTFSRRKSTSSGMISVVCTHPWIQVCDNALQLHSRSSTRRSFQ